MSTYNFFREDAMPASPVASSIYAIKGPGATEAQIYIVGTDPVTDTRHLITAAEVDAKITAANVANAEMLTAADITARDALTLTQNQLVMVTDASDDTTVTAGTAVYFYTQSDDSWTKIYEFEGMDVVLEWTNIQGKPVSSVSDIELAATRAAAHTETVLDIDTVVGTLKGNQTELAKISEDLDGHFVYDGVTIDRKNYMGDTSTDALIDGYTSSW